MTETVAKDAIAKWGESVSTRTIKERLFDLRACWEWAKGKYHLAEGSNPWDGCLERIRHKQNDIQTERKEIFTLADLQIVITAFQNHPQHNHYTDFVVFLFGSGCRIGEAAALLWKDLAKQDETIPNQLGKSTSSPTLRWVFQCFMAVHLVVFQGVQQVVNLTDERLHILQFFSPACRRYSFLCDPDS